MELTVNLQQVHFFSASQERFQQQLCLHNKLHLLTSNLGACEVCHSCLDLFLPGWQKNGGGGVCVCVGGGGGYLLFPVDRKNASANSTMFPTIPMDLCCQSPEQTRSRGIASTNPWTLPQALRTSCLGCKANLS